MNNTIIKPLPKFSKQAHIKSLKDYNKLYKQSIDDPEKFWSNIASESYFFKKWNKVLEWNIPDAKWFIGGETNIAYNCLDYQISQGRGDHVAIIWESESVDEHHKPLIVRKITYRELLLKVNEFANGLKRIGIKKGDLVTIYMPMIPELMIAILACARIGAPHSVIFAGFSANAIADRVDNSKSRYIITTDGGYRRGNIIPLKDIVDEACNMTNFVEKIITLKYVKNNVFMKEGRDIWWDKFIEGCSEKFEAEPVDSEHILFLLYTSGSTGKPKGIIHTTAGYMVYAKYTSKLIFDLHKDDIYWCTADIGWITGHTYVIYGPLQNGITSIMYEGAPNYPNWERFWAICERYKVTKFYTAPTAIRSFMKEGRDLPKKYDLSSLKLLGTVGEHISPIAWNWYNEHIGNNKCPIVDTWWQTETGGIMIAPLPGAIPAIPGSATLPLPGIKPLVLDRDGSRVENGNKGLLCIQNPWPGMLRGIYGDRELFKQQYFSKIKGVYFSGDGAKIDNNGYFWITGRIDDVINVAGHRLGTAEIESIVTYDPHVSEAAVIGCPDDIKGEAICIFVILKKQIKSNKKKIKDILKNIVIEKIGKIACPKNIWIVNNLPKTRSGKIMRRLLRELVIKGEIKGDISTLEDISTISKLQMNQSIIY